MTKTLNAILFAGCTSMALSYGAETTWRHDPYNASGYVIVSGNPNYNPLAAPAKETDSRSRSASSDAYVSIGGVSPVSQDSDGCSSAQSFFAWAYFNAMTAVSNGPELPTYEEWRRGQNGSPLAAGYSSGSSNDASPNEVPLPSYMKEKR